METKQIIIFLCFLAIFNKTNAEKKAAKFVQETVAQQNTITGYKKIGTSSHFGLFGQNSKTQCSEVCLHEDDCRSVHMEGGACVFGVSGDVTAFHGEGVNTTPPQDQIIKTKCKYMFNQHSYKCKYNYTYVI